MCNAHNTVMALCIVHCEVQHKKCSALRHYGVVCILGWSSVDVALSLAMHWHCRIVKPTRVTERKSRYWIASFPFACHIYCPTDTAWSLWFWKSKSPRMHWLCTAQLKLKLKLKSQYWIASFLFACQLYCPTICVWWFINGVLTYSESAHIQPSETCVWVVILCLVG